jgi:tuberculosinol/isotuberculosinol synthase
MDAGTFHSLSRDKVAQIMHEAGPKVCVFPLNGTRRWFMLERAKPNEDFASAYLDAITTRLVEICQLLFDHGIDTLLLPILSPHLFRARGDEYTKMTIEALTFLTDHPKFLAFYASQSVRVRFYGDYVQYFTGTPYAYLLEHINTVVEKTFAHEGCRLFWGVCADDGTETTASLAIKYYKEHGCEPDKQTLVKMYYGEDISPVDLFITASKPRAFDMPLITNGREDLYFTVAPSPYLTETQLRDILHDHLYERPKEQFNYQAMTPEDWHSLHQYYEANKKKTLGVGSKHQEWGIWRPLP